MCTHTHAHTKHIQSQVCLNNPEDKDEQSSDISTSYRTVCVFQSVLVCYSECSLWRKWFVMSRVLLCVCVCV